MTRSQTSARLLAGIAGLALTAAASAQQQMLMVPDSTADKIMLFSAVDGSLVNGSFILDAGGTPFDFNTPKDVIQVGNEIWVSDQVSDAVFRFDLQGQYLSTISGGLDNIRGMELVGNTVYVTNSGTANGAPGLNAVVKFDTAGNNLGNFVAAASPFDVVALNATEILVAGSGNNPDVTRHDLAGTLLGTWHNGAINFCEQAVRRSTGTFLIAGFTDGNIHEYDAAGTEIGILFAAPGARGVWELQNGNIMWTAGTGVHVKDLVTGGDTVIVTGSPQFIGLLGAGTPPPPSCYPNCDHSTVVPFLNVLDFNCFLNSFAAGDSYANCDGSTIAPVLNVLDFNCFLNSFSAGCSAP
jgi:hypothetical protein